MLHVSVQPGEVWVGEQVGIRIVQAREMLDYAMRKRESTYLDFAATGARGPWTSSRTRFLEVGWFLRRLKC